LPGTENAKQPDGHILPIRNFSCNVTLAKLL
jgi:hypothetical protein